MTRMFVVAYYFCLFLRLICTQLECIGDLWLWSVMRIAVSICMSLCGEALHAHCIHTFFMPNRLLKFHHLPQAFVRHIFVKTRYLEGSRHSSFRPTLGPTKKCSLLESARITQSSYLQTPASRPDLVYGERHPHCEQCWEFCHAATSPGTFTIQRDAQGSRVFLEIWVRSLLGRGTIDMTAQSISLCSSSTRRRSSATEFSALAGTGTASTSHFANAWKKLDL